MNRKFWWIEIVGLATLGTVGFAFIGVETYRTARVMRETYNGQGAASEWADAAAGARVTAELKHNAFDAATNSVALSAGQVAAARALPAHFAAMFSSAGANGGAGTDAGSSSVMLTSSRRCRRSSSGARGLQCSV